MEPERNTRRNLEFIPGVPHPVEDPPQSTNGVNMEFSEAKRLLNPDPLPLEMGVERLPSGQLHVAVRTYMLGCTGEMFQWWFGSGPDARDYAWWHPCLLYTSDAADEEDSV